MSTSQPGSTLPARAAGYKAGKDGKTINDNPYQTAANRDAWIKGFKDFQEKVRTIRK